MLFALVMFFDKETEKIIYGYLEDLKRNNISTYLMDMESRPHITIGIYNDIDPDDCVRKLEIFCANIREFDLTISSLGIFVRPKPCVFLAPVVNRMILDLHEELQNLYKSLDNEGYEFYMCNHWVPHCAIDISIDMDKIRRSADCLMKSFMPVSCKVVGMGWVEISKPVRYLNEYGLTKDYSLRR